MVKTQRKNVARQFGATVSWLDRRSGGWITIVRQSLSRFRDMRGLDASASLAYYALFSIFPLTLVLAFILDFFFRGEYAYQRAVAFIRAVFPFSGELIDHELRSIFIDRGTFGIIGGLGLIWAASGFFTTLAVNINMAWPKVKLRGYVQNRLMAFAMVGAMTLMMMVSILTTTLISVVQSMLNSFGDSQVFFESPGWLLGLRLLSALFTFLTFLAMYRWVPNKTVNWRSVTIGALVIMLIWEGARAIFTLYLSSGLARFEFVYGSLGALIALMVWIYFGNAIALYGAYLVATLDMMNDASLSTKAGPEEEAHEISKTVRG